VRFQMDVFWVVQPGQDPVKLFEKYGKRFELMHLKDMKRGTIRDFTGHSDVTNSVPLGAGVIDMKNVLKPAKQAGVKWYFPEDESPTVMAQVPTSLKYLQELKF
jgi:sugar phosphate isomerase/epimerase